MLNVLLPGGLESPQFSENGAWFPPTGTVHVLVIFAGFNSDISQTDVGQIK